MNAQEKEVPYFQYYIDLVPEQNAFDALTRQTEVLVAKLEAIDESMGEHAYEDGKWTVKQLLQHITDTERIFSYRALTIARENGPSLAGFDHDMYVSMLDLSNRSLKDVVTEFKLVRQSIVALFQAFTAFELTKKGKANNIEMSVGQIGKILVGHAHHHIGVLEERYL